MNREEEIREAALEYVRRSYISNDTYDAAEDAFIDGSTWADSHPQGIWHSVVDGDWPKEDILTNHTLIVFGNGFGLEYDVQYIAKDKCFGFSIYNSFDEDDTFEVIDGVEYWMEIPPMPKESEVKKWNKD